MTTSGNTQNPKIVVVLDPPTESVHNQGRVMSIPSARLFGDVAVGHGFQKEDFAFVSSGPPLPDTATTDKRAADFLALHREPFLKSYEELCSKPSVKMVMYMGKWAGRQLTGRAIKITKVRGKFTEIGDRTVTPMLSPSHILRRPEMRDIFQSDFGMVAAYRDAGWKSRQQELQAGKDYKWCMDLSEVMDLDNPHKGLSVDTETAGGRWYHHGSRILTLQISWVENQGIAIPLDAEYWNDPELRGVSSNGMPLLTPRLRMKLIHQLRRLLANKDVHICGSAPKYDSQFAEKLDIFFENMTHDTVQLAFVADDNMQNKGLSEVVRRWVPSMAGYSDTFDCTYDKAHMEMVPHDPMLLYGCGDTDATRKATTVLHAIGKQDKANYECYKKIQMPALRAFTKMEQYGMRMDAVALQDLADLSARLEEELRVSLLGRIDPRVKCKHLEVDPKADPTKVLAFSRAAFVIDVLFGKKSEGGMGIKPRVFTKSTMKLPPAERIPSTSAKDHLSYFETNDFVRDLMDYQRLQKLRSTYIGGVESITYSSPKLLKSGKKYESRVETALASMEGVPEIVYTDGAEQEMVEEVSVRPLKQGLSVLLDANGVPWLRTHLPAKGFWQYMDENHVIYPSYFLDTTVTGRTSSRNPNGQNIPKRGKTKRMDDLVKAYRKCFIAPEGMVLLEADLSQAELRIAAWMANDKTMLDIYKAGGDIHAMTAARSMGITLEEFMALPEDVRKIKRFLAKAVNFGFLYGMGWRGFKIYAKTDYGLDLTDREAEANHMMFFGLYKGLKPWHEATKVFAQKHGYVRALHGALRRLPSVNSDDEGVQGGATRQAVNSPVQRLASDIGLMGMIQFAQGCPWERQRPTGFIHDAVVLSAKRGPDALEAAQAILYYMGNAPLREWFGLEPPIPLPAEVSIGWNLGAMAEHPEIQPKKPSWHVDTRV